MYGKKLLIHCGTDPFSEFKESVAIKNMAFSFLYGKVNI